MRLPEEKDENKSVKTHNIYFRIITDRYAGYEVQTRRRFLFWGWWGQCHKAGFTNTFRTLGDAKQWISDGLPKSPKKETRNVVWMSDNCH